MYMIFILIGVGFLMLSVKFSFSLGVCILYAGCSLFCFLLAASMMLYKENQKEAKRIREFFIDKHPKEINDWLKESKIENENSQQNPSL